MVVEFFNLFNHPNVVSINPFYGSGATAPQPLARRLRLLSRDRYVSPLILSFDGLYPLTPELILSIIHLLQPSRSDTPVSPNIHS
jgi:hypothetical protein